MAFFFIVMYDNNMNIIPISALKDNYIWLLFNEATHQAFAVDPGDAGPVLLALQQMNLQLQGILITHHHHDHSGGIPELLQHYPDIHVYASDKSTLPFITHPVREGDIVTCGDIELKALAIPGHTLDHTALYNNDTVFSGDTLFSFGCGRVFEGTPSQMYESLNKLKLLNPATKIYCGHEYTLTNLKFAKAVEPDNHSISEKLIEIEKLRSQNIPTLPSVLQQELLLNPFLRCEDPAIIHAVENYSHEKLEGPVEIFATLRAWKNIF